MQQTPHSVQTHYRRSRGSYRLVMLQFAGIVGACWPVSLINLGHPLWLVLCAMGAGFGVWALAHNRIGISGVFPEPRPNMSLVTTGPYALVRHPMYGALMIMMIGIAGYNGNVVNWISAAVIVAVVIAKSVIEERLLPRVFPEYESYRSSTPHRFLPFVF